MSATQGRSQSLRQRVEALRDRFVEAGKPPDYSEFDRGVAAAYRDVARRLTEALTADDASGRTAPAPAMTADGVSRAGRSRSSDEEGGVSVVSRTRCTYGVMTCNGDDPAEQRRLCSGCEDRLLRTGTDWLCMCGRSRSDKQGIYECPYCRTTTRRFSHTLGWHVRRGHRTQGYGVPPHTGWACKTCNVMGPGGPGSNASGR